MLSNYYYPLEESIVRQFSGKRLAKSGFFNLKTSACQMESSLKISAYKKSRFGAVGNRLRPTLTDILLIDDKLMGV